jgi:hypothetical protein
MSDFEKNSADPRLATLRLARAIGARLRTPIDSAARDALIVALVDATREGSGDATQEGAMPIDELAIRRTSPSRRHQRRFAAAAAALIVIAGGVGIAVRTAGDLPVIVLASGASATGAPALDARGGAEMMRADGDAMIGLWIPTIYTFELADGVTLGADRATAWRMVAPSDLLAAATRLADALELPVPAPSEWDASALAVQTDGGANLWVSAAGDWYYGGPADLWPAWDCPAEPYEGDGRDGVVERDAPVECTPPAPPSGVPSAERARGLALEHLARLGVGEVRILDVYRDEWGASVQGELVIPGSSVSSGLHIGVGFVGEERLAWANGTLARPERLGDYPLIGLADALRRLEQEMNAWLEDGAFPMPRPLPADMTDGPSGDPDAPVSDDGAGSGTDGSVADGDGPVSILPVPEPGVQDGSPDGPSWEQQEPVERTIRIVAVELVTSLVWSQGDVQVLLPHYRLIDEDGGWWFVIALEDRYLSR